MQVQGPSLKYKKAETLIFSTLCRTGLSITHGCPSALLFDDLFTFLPFWHSLMGLRSLVIRGNTLLPVVMAQTLKFLYSYRMLSKTSVPTT